MLADLGLPNLTHVGGGIDIGYDLHKLVTLSLPALRTIAGQLHSQSHSADCYNRLQNLHIPVLASAGGIRVEGENRGSYRLRGLRAYSAPALRLITGDVYFQYARSMTSVSLPALMAVGLAPRASHRGFGDTVVG